MISLKSPAYEQEIDRQKILGHLQNVLTRSDIGFKDVTHREDIWKASQARADQVKGDLTDLALVGIGGSHLGVEAIHNALHFGDLQVTFFDNLDPIYFKRKWSGLNSIENTHWVITSKSGTTLETLALANFIEQSLKAEGLDLASRCTVITEFKSNPLYTWAKAAGVEVLELSEDIGGRFSVLTPVGVLPAAIMNLDIEGLRKGATWALANEDFVCDLAIQFLHSLKDEKFISMMWIYSDQLNTFGEWWQQLWAESLSKKVSLSGEPGPTVSTPIACRGANDQHSLLQQVIEGQRDKLVGFLTVVANNDYGEAMQGDLFGVQSFCLGKKMGQILKAEADANMQAMRSGGIPAFHLEVEKVDESALGALFMSFELLVATLGEVFQINTFDQPGVEQGKVLTKQLLQPS
ncbi:MAG: hypothetical protein CL677_04510 [Bdellovibrionaceae bacterium]|nr:hypothetical protein [Pseudobdellovibrionaceae bacterium]|tara:strand:- start:70830 stop:72050 length:1221 start_codon:yes stop_codon:yes gene_type:complete